MRRTRLALNVLALILFFSSVSLSCWWPFSWGSKNIEKTINGTAIDQASIAEKQLDVLKIKQLKEQKLLDDRSQLERANRQLQELKATPGPQAPYTQKMIAETSRLYQILNETQKVRSEIVQITREHQQILTQLQTSTLAGPQPIKILNIPTFDDLRKNARDLFQCKDLIEDLEKMRQTTELDQAKKKERLRPSPKSWKKKNNFMNN